MNIHKPTLGGGDKGTRTPGLSIANAALYQLSYIPTARNILQHIDVNCKRFVEPFWAEGKNFGILLLTLPVYNCILSFVPHSRGN